MNRLFAFFLLFILFELPNVQAQKWEAGANFGGTGYMGDINIHNPLQYTNLGGGLSVKYNLNPTWGIKGTINYLRIDGNESKSDTKENKYLSFQSNLFELATLGEFNFFKFKPGKGKVAYTPYLFAGVGVSKFAPYLHYKGNKIDLHDIYAEEDINGIPVDYKKIALVVPFGAGFKYNLNGPISIAGEIGYRTIFSDHLDNVGQYYTSQSPTNTNNLDDYETWTNFVDPSGNYVNNKGKLRGDGRPYDGYMTAGITVSYTFFSTKCYWW